MSKTLLVTGGYGFIGSHYVLQRLKAGDKIVNVDKLTYAADRDNLRNIQQHPNYFFVHADIGDMALVGPLFKQHEVDAVVHFAAESHVDNSIAEPLEFVRTNVLGTAHLLHMVQGHWSELPAGKKECFRFLHVSTDEVFGSLEKSDKPFSRETPYDPRSPYSATKAASDHLVRAWYHTYGLPTIITNCSNNFGPHQHAEKLIPKIILNCLRGEEIPIYGKGDNIRDWIYVEDHCHGIQSALEHGETGETYLFGGRAERSNNQIAEAICALMDQLEPGSQPYGRLITHVTDRAGHDYRYAIDTAHAEKTLKFKPSAGFEERLEQTVRWYIRKEKGEPETEEAVPPHVGLEHQPRRAAGK